MHACMIELCIRVQYAVQTTFIANELLVWYAYEELPWVIFFFEFYLRR